MGSQKFALFTTEMSSENVHINEETLQLIHLPHKDTLKDLIFMNFCEVIMSMEHKYVTRIKR